MTSANEARVLLTLPQDLLDRARVLSGEATVALRLPVSLQIVLRALIGEGLKRAGDPAVLTNVEAQAHALHHLRSVGGQARSAVGRRGDRSGLAPRTGGR